MEDNKISGAIREVLESGNRENAKGMVREAGYPNGISLDLDLSRFGSAGDTKRDAQIMAAKLATAGIRIRIFER